VQKKIIKNFILIEKKKIVNHKNYSIIVLGGNHEKRLFKACEIINNYQIHNVLIIMDNIDKNTKNNTSGCLTRVNVIENNLIPSSTIDDVEIIKNKLKMFSEDIILITDDFHAPRLNFLIKDLKKNFIFQTIKNIEKEKYNKFIDIMHGIKLFNIISKEYIAIVYYKIFI
tara:strand:+ start:884 stop:1393 length:510 start_codon:yes stop_codon:yes gene_type:complete